MLLVPSLVRYKEKWIGSNTFEMRTRGMCRDSNGSSVHWTQSKSDIKIVLLNVCLCVDVDDVIKSNEFISYKTNRILRSLW